VAEGIGLEGDEQGRTRTGDTMRSGAANRDPRAFPDPDRFDLDRIGSRHLGLGQGAHFCVGGPLARVLARVAAEDLVARAARIEIDPRTAVRVSPPNFRGFRHLDVTVGPGSTG